MADPKLQIEISGEAGGLFVVIAKVEEKLKAIQAGSESSADAARRSMGALEQGAKAAAQALKQAEAELAAIRSKLAASGGGLGIGGDATAAMARVQQAQANYTRIQAMQLAAEQTLGQQRVMTYLRSSQATDTATKSLQTHGQVVDKASQSHQNLAGSVFQSGAALMALRAALEGAREVLTAMLDANLALEKAERTLQMATGDGAGAMAFVRRTARELGLELVATADGYAMMAAAAKGTSMEGKATENVFRSVARASAAMSLSGEQTHGIILALSQMMSKGKVMAEELRKQLGEHLPGAFNIAARAMGVTTAELDNMLRNGQVISSQFLPKFAKELELALGDAPERAAQSLQANINRIKTSFQSLSYEVGQGGAGGSLSKALADIAKLLDSPEGLLAIKEMSGDLAKVITVAKDLAVTLWTIRGPLVALAEAWVAVKVAQIIKGVADWGLAKAELIRQTLAARQAILEEALATEGLTLAKGQNAQAEVAKALAMVASRRATTENAIAMGTLSLAEGEATLKSIALSEAKLAEAAAMTAAGRAGSAAAGGIAAMGGVAGLVIAGIGALVFTLTQLESASEKANKAEAERLAISTRNRQTSQGMLEDANRLNAVLRDETTTVDQKRRAQDQLQTVIKQLLVLYPEMAQHLKKEGELYLWSTEATKEHTERKLESAKATAAQAEASIKAAEAEIALTLAHADAMVARNPEAGMASAGLRMAADQRKRELEGMRENLRTALSEVQNWQKQLDALLNPAKPPKPDDTSSDDGTGHLITQSEIQARLAAIRASADEKHTLEQQKQLALDKADVEYLQEKAKLEKEASSEEGKFFGKQEGLNDLWAANEQRRADRRMAIERDFTKKRSDLETDLQARVAAQEEGGLKKREEMARKFANKLREDNERLIQEGKKPYTEEQIQAAQAAERERLRVVQIRNDLTTLKHEISELEKMNGGPLTKGEMAAALDHYAQKSKEAAAAAAILRQELHMDETAFQGWSAGIRNYVTQSENQYTNFKNHSVQMLNGIENAWARTTEGILTGQIKGGQILKSIWQGTAQVMAQVVSQIIARWLMLQVADAMMTKTQMAQSGAKTAAYLTEGAAGAWAAYGWIPYVGAFLALAQIAAMEASVSAVGLSGSAASKSFSGGSLAEGGEDTGSATWTGAAGGGWFDRPTKTIMGEGWQRELAVPEVSFKDFAGNLASNILAQERQAVAYSRLASSYASNQPMSGYGSGQPVVQKITQIYGHYIDTSQRGRRELGELVTDGQRSFSQERSVVLRSRDVMGGL